MGILLGDVSLDGFEIAGPVRFGGRQAMAVHKLPGGARIIDAMGADDDAISWHGIICGGNATERARTLDALRVDGIAVPLAWDMFSAVVILSKLRLQYCNSWWIPYHIECTIVVGTQVADTSFVGPNLLAAVLADLELAGSAPGVGTARSALNEVTTLATGNQAFAAASTSLTAADQAVRQAVSLADAGVMDAGDINTLVSSAGVLASLSASQGYLSRAVSNFASVGV